MNDTTRFAFTGATPLAQFARVGLALTIGDFRQLAEELNGLLPVTAGLDDTEVVEALFKWMTVKVEEASAAQNQVSTLKPPSLVEK